MEGHDSDTLVVAGWREENGVVNWCVGLRPERVSIGQRLGRRSKEAGREGPKMERETGNCSYDVGPACTTHTAAAACGEGQKGGACHDCGGLV